MDFVLYTEGSLEFKSDLLEKVILSIRELEFHVRSNSDTVVQCEQFKRCCIKVFPTIRRFSHQPLTELLHDIMNDTREVLDNEKVATFLLIAAKIVQENLDDEMSDDTMPLTA
jgi:hypothetical protein